MQSARPWRLTPPANPTYETEALRLAGLWLYVGRGVNVRRASKFGHRLK